ncbi:hypothetical protein ACH5RR_023533 [Cinchona calisaya]|uniref:Neprosin PEP catalytic domain-containing protein n=1 Tax=Cinchona calisaya TaxID=153742 RepID=A0ABD2ZAX8_9GENT
MFNFEAHSKKDRKPITQLWQLNGECPDATIPIRRTKREDSMRKNTIKKYGTKKFNIIPYPSLPDIKFANQVGLEHVIAFVEDKFYGAKGTINVWKPQIQIQDECSLSGIWLLGGSDTGLNSIQAGWMVYPKLFGDNNTRFFIYWTRDGYNSTGCYNLQCSGFVQVTKQMALGAAIKPISIYHGSQSDFTLTVWKDERQKVWWLRFQDTIIGYWPTSIFTYLGDRASVVEWGGLVTNTNLNGQHTTTQMGSGHFAEEWFRGASYFRNLEIIEQTSNIRSANGLGNVVDKPKCYNLKFGNSEDWGNFFYYGGPGKNPNCP